MCGPKFCSICSGYFRTTDKGCSYQVNQQHSIASYLTTSVFLYTMKRIFTLTVLCFHVVMAWSQPNMTATANEITKEGRQLYQLELAAWYGTDFFLAGYSGDRNMVGGYFSYPDAGKTICVFFNKGNTPQILGTISYGSNFEKPNVDSKTRAMTALEKQYFLLRATAIHTLDKDTFFVKYKNCIFTTIPLIEKGIKKVYVLTTTDLGGLIIFGNDYLMTFNEQNKLLSKKRFHNGVFTFNYINNNETTNSHVHNTAAGSYITATDVCTLLLHSQFTKWKTYKVTSDLYQSVWDCGKQTLSIIRKK